MHVHDDRRLDRIGMPEAVLCSAKSDSQLRVIVDELASTGHPTLLTRFPAERLVCLSAEVVEQTTTRSPRRASSAGCSRVGRAVAIAAAGTSDQRVATEAARTLEFSGVDVEVFVEIGAPVCGVWRPGCPSCGQLTS